MSEGKILVTGGTGYVGSHTAVELVNAGFEVVIADDLSNSDISTLDGIEKITGTRPDFEELDLCERQGTEALFEKHNIVGVIHFAANKAVGESVEKPVKYYRNNIVSLLNLLECMQKRQVSKMVFSSSCTVYGQPDELPVTESSPRKQAESPYGNTKKICEDIIQDTVNSGSGIKAVSLRYFNPIGAHPSAEIGELPIGEPENLVPYITQTAIGIRPELRVFGDDYDTPDGSCIRDYIYVVDLAKAHVIAMQRLINGTGSDGHEIFNLGTGNGYSVLETVKAFETVSGEKLNYSIVGRRAGDIVKIWADTSLANNELGWKAETGLEEMILSAWNWEKAYRSKQG